jgi:N-acetyl-gamma-glutamyl-phosphate reductase
MFMRFLHAYPSMRARARVAVIGASGYSGGELVRLLLGHPGVELERVGAASSAGARLAEVHPHLAGTPAADLVLEPAEAVAEVEVAFLAMPHGRAAELAPALLDAGTRVIDLSGDFRLPAAAYPEWYGFEHPAPAWLGKAVYGLPELFRDQIRGAELVANPGCYPTPVALGLAPLLAEGLAGGPVLVDGKTGLSGAGRTATEQLSYVATEESVRPYRFPAHQHTPEMERVLERASGVAPAVSFVPHLVPSVRGVLVTAYVRVADGVTTENLTNALARAYAAEPFVRVLPAGAMVDTKRTRGTNVVELQAVADPRTGTAIVVGALDNLVKGAAGQAIQNLNLLLGVDEITGLSLSAVYP